MPRPTDTRTDGRPALVAALGNAERRRRALDRADALITLGQTDVDGIDEALAAALDDAADWPEVRVLVLHAMAARATFTRTDTTEICDELHRTAVAHGMRAMEAIALCYRLEATADPRGAVPFDALVEIRLLLDDARQPVRDRVAGLIALAELYGQFRLHAQEDDTLVEVARLAEQLDDPTRTSAVTAANQALAAAVAVLDAAEAGMVEEATLARRRLDHVAHGPSWELLPTPWRRRLEAYRRLAGAVVDGETLSGGEVDDLVRGVDGDTDIVTLLGLVTPIESWPGAPDIESVSPDRINAARFLHTRALDLNGPASRVCEAHRRHARSLAAKSWQVRRAAGSALAERIASRRLDAERRSLEMQVLTDPLTGVRNRRAFEAALERAAGEPSTLVTLDLDRFKAVNDRWGHQIGDVVLQRVAAALAATVGFELHGRLDAAEGGPLVARVGGDEFVVFVGGDDGVAGRRLAAELEAAVEAVDWSGLLGDDVQRVTVGVACGPCEPALFEASDLDMYDRKPRHEARISH